VIIADTNFTQGTFLLPWNDKYRTYVPVNIGPSPQGKAIREEKAQTSAFGANLDCTEMTFGTRNTLYLSYSLASNNRATIALGLTLRLPNGCGRKVESNQFNFSNLVAWSVACDIVHNTSCTSEPVGTEFSMTFEQSHNLLTPDYAINTCTSSIVLIWVRYPGAGPDVCNARIVSESLAGAATPIWSNRSRNATVDLTAHAGTSTPMNLVRCTSRSTVSTANTTIDCKG
jgi:hypothetical protein